MSIRREIIDCGAMRSRNMSQLPDNVSEEIENNIDTSSTETFKFESDWFLSTTNKIFLNDSGHYLSDEDFQGILKRIYVNHEDKPDDPYIPTGNKYVDQIQSVTGLYILEAGNVWNTFEKESIGLFYLFMSKTYICECVRTWTNINMKNKGKINIGKRYTYSYCIRISHINMSFE